MLHGKVAPNDAPGFGMEIKSDLIEPYNSPAANMDITLKI
jgi:hypothetical protein